jgi:hypothetical protein
VAFTASSPYNKSPNRLLSTVAGGWALNGIVQVTSGQPFTVTTGTDAENIGCCLQERANVTGNSSGPKTQAQWFNIGAFSTPAAYTYGNEKPNSLVSQHWNNVDMSVFRQFHLGLGEERYFEFRAEAFNAFNNVVFGVPHTSLNAGLDPNGKPIFGSITSQRNVPRELQMSLKFYY